MRLRNYSKTSAQVLPGIGYDVSRGEAERTPYSKLLYAKLLNAEKYSEKLEPTVNFMPFLITLLAILVNNAIFNAKNTKYLSLFRNHESFNLLFV